MTNFKSNIINIYGDKGKAWLDELPLKLNNIASKLSLRELEPVSNLSCNYVLSGFQSDAPIILKIGLDTEGLLRESEALKCFKGYDAVNVIAEEKGLLLLERAIPGTSLKTYFPDKDSEALEITCTIMKKLHKATIPAKHNFPHIKDWLAILDKDWDIPTMYLQKAKILRHQLLETSQAEVLLHGDLHHDNILQNGEDEEGQRFRDGGWVIIDPKGVIGDPTFELVAFILNPIPELLYANNQSDIISKRITLFSMALDITSQRIIEWCFVKSTLSWAWCIEDNTPSYYFEEAAKIFYELVKTKKA